MDKKEKANEATVLYIYMLLQWLKLRLTILILLRIRSKRNAYIAMTDRGRDKRLKDVRPEDPPQDDVTWEG